jgi:hypothetical protein
MNININVEQLKAAIRQIKSPPTSLELAELALQQLPKNMLDDLIQTVYFEKVLQTPYFILQHATLRFKKYYFTTLEETTKFLNENSLRSTRTTKEMVETAIKNKIVLEGYEIFYINK